MYLWHRQLEYRLNTIPNRCVQQIVDGALMEFLEFDRSWVKRVDIGARCEETDRRGLIDCLTREYAHASRYQARFHDDEYALVYDPA